MSSATFTFTIPRDQWLSSNQRLHWAVKAKKVAWIRDLAARRIWVGNPEMGHQKPMRKQARIVAHIGYATNGRADPANAHPTVKACVDGLVDAGVLIDDSHEYVIGPDYRRDPVKAPKGFHTVRLEIEEVGQK